MRCDQSEQVHAYHDGELDQAAARAVEAHLADCPACAGLLAELRGLSRMIAGATLAAMPDRAMARIAGSWNASRDRGVLRIVSWLTAAAAALLLGAILRWPAEPAGAVAPRANSWEVAALTPPAAPTGGEGHGEGRSESVQVAQWIANDLSYGDGR